MRIAIAIRKINTKSGLGKIVLEQIKYCVNNNILCDVYTNDYDENIKKLPIKIIKFFNIPLLNNYLQRVMFSKLFKIMSIKNHYDLVIGHGDIMDQDVLFMHNLVEKTYLMINNKPMHKLNGVAKFHRNLFLKNQFSLVIANSNLMKNELIKSFGIDEHKIKVFYPAYDSEQFNIVDLNSKKQKAKQDFGFQENDIVIGFITSGDFKNRNLDLFIEALYEIKQKRFDFKVLLIGKTTQLKVYLEKIEQYNLTNNFNIQPLSDNIENYYYASDFTVHPAHYEAFGMVLEEAMASGIPVITSRNVGAHEIMISQDLVLESITKEELIEKIILLMDEHTRKFYSELAVKSIENRIWINYIQDTFDMCYQVKKVTL